MKRLLCILVVLLCAAQSFGQCDPGGCPSQRPGILQGILGRAGGEWQVPQQQQELPGFPEVPSPPESPITEGWRASPPEYIVRIDGGTGTLIYKDDKAGVILTAAHVLSGEDTQRLPVIFPDGEHLTGKAIRSARGRLAKDDAFDIALVEIPSPKATPCEMATTWPKAGEAITICGYRMNRTYRAIRGNVLNYFAPSNGSKTSMMEVSGEAYPGDSGGPIFNSRGELCGVISASSWAGSGNYTVGASLPRIHALCSDLQYIFPWRRDIRDRIEGDEEAINNLGSQIGGIRQEIGKVQPLPPAPVEKFDDAPLRERVTALEVSDKTQADGITRLNTIIEEIKKAAEEYAASPDAQKQALAAAVKDVEGRVAGQLASQLDQAAVAIAASTEEKAKAVAGEIAVSAAGAVAETVAKDAAGKAVEAATPGLLEKIKGFLPEGLQTKIDAVTGALGWMKNAIFGSYAGLGILALALWLSYRDVKAFIRTGGEDKLMIQNLAARTSTSIDDAAADRIASLIQHAAERMGRWPATPPAAPKPEG